MPATTQHSRGMVAGIVAAVLAVGGGGAIAWSASHQQHAPQPSAADVGVLPSDTTTPTASPSGSDVATPTGVPAVARGLVLAPAKPVSLTIASIGVSSAVNTVGLAADGSVDVPQPGPHYDEAAWFTGSPTPGQLGPAVIEGHVDSASAGPSVFYRLGAVHIGDTVDVARADGSTARFAVTAVRSFPKDKFPTSLVYGDTAQAALRIVTCGGTFDTKTGHYRNNVVVFATLVSSR